MSSAHSAAHSFGGYLYQARYALYILLRKRGNYDMRIEHFDDIEVQSGSSSPLELIQTKCHTKSNRSLGDNSKDLWTTLGIWSELLYKGILSPEKMVLTLVTTSVAPDDSAASKLRPGSQNGRNARIALDKLLEKAKTPTKETEHPKEAFMKLKESQQLLLLENVHVIDAAPNLLNMKEELEKELLIEIDERFVKPLYERLEGWWINKVIEHLSSSDSGVITFNEMQTKLAGFAQDFHDDNLPIHFDDNTIFPPEVLLLDNRTFIKQLKLIDVSSKRITRAAKQLYRASEQRAKWVKDDPRVGAELEDYDRKLIEEWSLRFDRMGDELPSQADPKLKLNVGQKFYEWFEEAHVPLRARINHPFVTRGSYQMLSDTRRIGWHIDYGTLV